MSQPEPKRPPESRDALSERKWIEGHRAAWARMLEECLRQLGADDPAAGAARWLAEREAAVAMLRQVCAEHGDNDWPDDLHLGDAIEKHLWRHLPEPDEGEGDMP